MTKLARYVLGAIVMLMSETLLLTVRNDFIGANNQRRKEQQGVARKKEREENDSSGKENGIAYYEFLFLFSWYVNKKIIAK